MAKIFVLFTFDEILLLIVVGELYYRLLITDHQLFLV